ncbi:hypothetical protein ACJMK2_037706, partial [Sinanodonta woodiana]
MYVLCLYLYSPDVSSVKGFYQHDHTLSFKFCSRLSACDCLYERELGSVGITILPSDPDPSMDPPPSSVEEMEYKEVIDLMAYLNMKSTESGERDRSLLKNYLYTERRIGSYEDKIQDTVNKSMKKFVAEKKRLLESYIEINKMAKKDWFKNEISSNLEKRFPKYKEQLQERITKLTNDEIEICIFGWTSAGKSTFANILLGVDIMPTQFLPDTQCLVRLHNSQTRKLEYEAEGEKLTVHLTKDPQDAKFKLKAIFDQRRGNDLATLDVLDLYWPIPMLHENVVIVDTPGIGENNSQNELVMKHVPNAAGYICVINSGDDGGILEGGIVQLFKAIANKEVQTENNLGNVLFICNKWDMIKIEDRQYVSENTRKKLKKYFGVVEDWQIIHFSAIMEFQLMQLRASTTDDFLTILEGLDRLVSRTVTNLIFDFLGWIKNLVGKSVEILDKKMNSIALSNDELKERTSKATTVLDDAKRKLESNSRDLENMVDTKKSELIKNLQDYLTCPGVQERAFNWNYTDLITKQPSDIIKEHIHKLISEWAENNEGVLKKSIADAERKCRQCATDIETAFYPDRTEVGNIQQHFVFRKELVAITPLVTVMMSLCMTYILKHNFKLSRAALTVIVTTGGIHIAKNYFLLKKLILETLKTFSDDTRTGNHISTLFETPVNNCIKQFRSTMQREIASQDKYVKELITDKHRAIEFQIALASLLDGLKKSLTNLEEIGVEYYSDD